MASDEPIPGVPTLRGVQQHLVRPDAPVRARVVSTERCTPSAKAAYFARHVCIDVGGTPLERGFVAGQSFGVVPPGTDDRGRPHKLRLYSIASPTRGEDGDGRVLSTTVKRVIDEHYEDHRLFLGVCSNYLCDRQVGDEVLVTGPAGKRFVLPEDPSRHDYVFFATGTGIAPFRAMLLDLLHAGFPSRVLVVMGVPYATDLLYHEWLTTLQQDHPEFTYLTAISRQINPDANRRLYVQDRLDTHADLLASFLDSDRTLVYICGMAGMEIGIFKAMARLLPPQRLAHYLRVKPAAGDPENWERKMIPRTIAPTKRTFLEVY
ncbi:MAG: hypothetical protein ACF8Q5_12030 [Phycisphaerales bacterium JB040]